MKEIFCDHTVPEIIQCDNGPEFRGEAEKFFQERGIQVRRGRPYHPQSQGKVERNNRDIKAKIRFLTKQLFNYLIELFNSKFRIVTHMFSYRFLSNSLCKVHA